MVNEKENEVSIIALFQPQYAPNIISSSFYMVAFTTLRKNFEFHYRNFEKSILQKPNEFWIAKLKMEIDSGNDHI